MTEIRKKTAAAVFIILELAIWALGTVSIYTDHLLAEPEALWVTLTAEIVVGVVGISVVRRSNQRDGSPEVSNVG